ncbi:hypothetical protein Aduo_009076 [Ancylostoma duodenale]
MRMLDLATHPFSDSTSVNEYNANVEHCRNALWAVLPLVCLPWQLDCGFGNPRCIPKKKLHDGKIDCYSGLDEGCPSHYFVCKDKSTCIEPELFQDGKRHCADGSDEPCAPGQFPCSDASKCIPLAKFQDGVEDCADGSDEECTTSQLECGCGRTRCVSRKQVGDDFWDCEDGSDELFNVTHSDVCPDGSRRRHGANSVLVGQLQLCTNSSLCHRKLGEICVVVGGSWRCVCQRGSVRLPGASRCIPTSEVEAYMKEPLPNCTRARQELSMRFGHTSGFLSKLAKPLSQRADIRRAPITRGPQSAQAATHHPNVTKVPSASAPGISRQKPTPSSKGEPSVPAVMQPLLSHQNQQKKLAAVYLGKSGDPCGRNESGSCGCAPTSTPINGACVPLLNECANATLNDCDPAAICMDSPLSYECLCREGYLDVSANPIKKPGRKCMKLVNECSDARSNDCSPHAKCIDKTVGYTCRCVPGYADISPGGLRKPGRKCVPLVNECETKQHDCDPRAMCRDEAVGYSCHCPFGFADISPNSTRPGRVCIQLNIECDGCNSTTSHCVPTAGGNVACACLPGFEDLDPINPGQNCSRLLRE